MNPQGTKKLERHNTSKAVNGWKTLVVLGLPSISLPLRPMVLEEKTTKRQRKVLEKILTHKLSAWSIKHSKWYKRWYIRWTLMHLFRKRSEYILGNLLPNFIIWVSYQHKEGASRDSDIKRTFDNIFPCSECLSLYHLWIYWIIKRMG